MKLNGRISLAVVFLSLIIVMPINVKAEDEGEIREHSISRGAWAVQFSVGSYFRLGAFDGMFSIKNHFTDKSALRLGLGYRQDTETTDPVSSGASANYYRYNFNISLAYVNYPRPQRNVKIYWGLGPEFGYDHEETIYSFAHFFEKRYSIGALVLIGFEWFATKEISLHAEYQSRIYYSDISGYSEISDNSFTGYGWTTTLITRRAEFHGLARG